MPVCHGMTSGHTSTCGNGKAPRLFSRSLLSFCPIAKPYGLQVWRFRSVAPAAAETAQNCMRNTDKHSIGYSHSIIKKCSAFTISPLIYSWLFLIVRRIDFDSPSKKLISNSVASRIIVERVFGLSFNGKRICRATCQASLFPTRWRFLSEQGFSERRAASDGMLAGADHLSVILLETQKECFSCSRRLFHYSCANSQCFWDGATWIGRYGPPSL